MEFKSSLKKVSFEEALEQRLTVIENEVASLQEERKINTNLKEELARQKKENTNILHGS